MADFGVVYGKKTARHICYLAEGLAFTTYFKEQIVVNQEVTFLRICKKIAIYGYNHKKMQIIIVATKKVMLRLSYYFMEFPRE